MTNATTERVHTGPAHPSHSPKPAPMPGDVIHVHGTGYAALLPRHTYLPSALGARIIASQRGVPIHHMERRSLELAEDCRRCAGAHCAEEQVARLKGDSRKEALADLLRHGLQNRKLAYASHCQMTAQGPPDTREDTPNLTKL